ncbi:MAG TPA: SPASM domain-containing protein, partial [Myxococcota bacterium]
TRIRGRGARADRAFTNVDAILAHRRSASAPQLQLLLQLVRQRENAGHAAPFLARYGNLGIAGVSAYVKELDANTVDDADALYEIGRTRRPYLCRAPWKSVVVLVEGSVVPCCHDANAAIVYGNIAHAPLASIWRDEAARSLRERLQSGSTRVDEPCGTCAHRADRYALPSLDAIPQEPLHW